MWDFFINDFFWPTATQLVELLVPIITITIVFGILGALLFGRR